MPQDVAKSEVHLKKGPDNMTSTSGQRRIANLLDAPPEGAWARLMTILRSNPRALIVAFFGTVTASLATLAQPALTGRLVGALKTMQLDRVVMMGGMLVGVAIAASLLTAVVNLVVAYASNNLVRQFRDSSATVSLRVPAEKLVDHPTSDLVARCSIDSEKLGEVFQHGPIQALGNLVMVLGSLIQMVRIDPVLAGAALGLCALAMVTIVVTSNRMTGISFTRQEAQGDYVAEVTRALDSILTIRAFVADHFAIGRLTKVSQRLQNAANRAARAQAFMEPLVQGLIQATLLAIILVAFLRVQSGALQVDNLVAFFMYTMMLITPVASSAETAMLMAASLGSLQRLIDLGEITRSAAAMDRRITTEADPVLETYEVCRPPDRALIQGDISFRNVSVRYNGEVESDREYALSDVSFDIPRGAWVSLTGTSGSGKSTILAVMEGFLTPVRGAVLVDGLPLIARDPDQYRSQIGYIEQACPLFAGTVRDNLILGRADITDEECWRMIEQVGLIETIAGRREGLDSPVGESAYAFSGGERQRLAIARALLRRPRLLLLDEITSGLDVVTRAQIMDLIRFSSGGITTLSASHGRHATLGCDQVLVLHKGRLVESGPPTEVQARSALFRSLIAQ